MPLNSVKEIYTGLLIPPRNPLEMYRFYKKNGNIFYEVFSKTKLLHKAVRFSGTDSDLFYIVKDWNCSMIPMENFNPISLKIKEMSERFEKRKKIDVKNSKRRTMSEVSVCW